MALDGPLFEAACSSVESLVEVLPPDAAAQCCYRPGRERVAWAALPVLLRSCLLCWRPITVFTMRAARKAAPAGWVLGLRCQRLPVIERTFHCGGSTATCFGLPALAQLSRARLHHFQDGCSTFFQRPVRTHPGEKGPEAAAAAAARAAAAAAGRMGTIAAGSPALYARIMVQLPVVRWPERASLQPRALPSVLTALPCRAPAAGPAAPCRESAKSTATGFSCLSCPARLSRLARISHGKEFVCLLCGNPAFDQPSNASGKALGPSAVQPPAPACAAAALLRPGIHVAEASDSTGHR